jgi:hypothetical protein
VIYLGFRVTRWRGLRTLFRLGGEIDAAAKGQPDGLLAQEFFLFGLTHMGLRQYWRDQQSLEAFTHAEPHGAWWRRYSKNTGGAGFWHEAYCKRGGMEAIYINMPAPLGFGRFAAAREPIGPFLSARGRLATNQ